MGCDDDDGNSDAALDPVAVLATKFSIVFDMAVTSPNEHFLVYRSVAEGDVEP